MPGAISNVDPERHESAAAAAAATSAADRRRSPRATYRVMFNIYPLLASGGGGGRVGPAVEVVLQDFSLVGMGIIHSSAMARGEQYQVPLLRGDGAEHDGAPMALLATVMRCEQLDDGLFNIGFEFNSSTAAVDEGSRQLTGRPAPRE